ADPRGVQTVDVLRSEADQPPLCPPDDHTRPSTAWRCKEARRVEMGHEAPPATPALRRLAAFAVLLGLLFVGGLLLGPHSAHQLRHELAGLGLWGPLVVAGAAALLTCAMVPG